MTSKTPAKTYPRTYVAVEGDTPRTVALANGLDDFEVARLNGVLREHVFAKGDKVSLGAGVVDSANVSAEYVEKTLTEKKGGDSEALLLVQHELLAAGLLDAAYVTGDYNDATPKALTLWASALGYDSTDDVRVLAALGSRRGRFSVIG